MEDRETEQTSACYSCLYFPTPKLWSVTPDIRGLSLGSGRSSLLSTALAVAFDVETWTIDLEDPRGQTLEPDHLAQLSRKEWE
jgi:hypothetical protein